MRAAAILHLAIASAMAFVTGYLVSILDGDVELTTWESVKFGTILVFAVTGVFAFLGYAWPLFRLLPESYYRTPPRRNAFRVEQRLGLTAFRRLLLQAYWGHGRRRRSFFDGTRRGTAAMERATRVAEFGHTASFVAVLAVVIWMFARGHGALASIALLVNVPMNLYPVFLQRWHRARLSRLRARLA